MQFKMCLQTSKEMASLQRTVRAEREEDSKGKKKRDAMSMAELVNCWKVISLLCGIRSLACEKERRYYMWIITGAIWLQWTWFSFKHNYRK